MRYYIADCHFFHRGLNEKMDKRGFADVEEMNEYMIRKWNKKVRPKDEVVILGDFSMEKGERTNEILRRLHGRLYLIEGNHDYYLKDSDFERERFVWIRRLLSEGFRFRTGTFRMDPALCGDERQQKESHSLPLSGLLLSRTVQERPGRKRTHLHDVRTCP